MEHTVEISCCLGEGAATGIDYIADGSRSGLCSGLNSKRIAFGWGAFLLPAGEALLTSFRRSLRELERPPFVSSKGGKTDHAGEAAGLRPVPRIGVRGRLCGARLRRRPENSLRSDTSGLDSGEDSAPRLLRRRREMESGGVPELV